MFREYLVDLQKAKFIIKQNFSIYCVVSALMKSVKISLGKGIAKIILSPPEDIEDFYYSWLMALHHPIKALSDVTVHPWFEDQ